MEIYYGSTLVIWHGVVIDMRKLRSVEKDKELLRLIYNKKACVVKDVGGLLWRMLAGELEFVANEYLN